MSSFKAAPTPTRAAVKKVPRAIAAKVRASMKESNKLLDKLEAQLFDQLSDIYRKIQRDLSLELSTGLAPINWTDIQYLYREEVTIDNVPLTPFFSCYYSPCFIKITRLRNFLREILKRNSFSD
jgi:hypothetical protein